MLKESSGKIKRASVLHRIPSITIPFILRENFVGFAPERLSVVEGNYFLSREGGSVLMQEAFVPVASAFLQPAIGTESRRRNLVFFTPDHRRNPFEECGIFLRHFKLFAALFTDPLHRGKYSFSWEVAESLPALILFSSRAARSEWQQWQWLEWKPCVR